MKRRVPGLRAGCVAFAIGVGLAAAPDGVRVIDLDPRRGEATPALSLAKDAVTSVTFVDADGAPWPIAALRVADGGPSAAREESHPHVAMLRSGSRGASGNVVALLDGLTEPVHLAVVRDAPAAMRVRMRIAGRAAGGGTSANVAPDAGANLSKEAVEAIVRDYLLANPGVLREALDPSRQLTTNVRRLRGEIVDQAGVPVAGDPSGSVTVVEFFDYNCGYCKRSADAVRAAAAHPGVRVELREYPILGEASERAAKLALAADLQGRYLDAHLALMERPRSLDDEGLPEELAAMLGLDASRLRADMASAEVAARIDANRRLADRLGVTGTPAFLVFGPESVEVSPGALDASRLRGLIASVE